MVNHRLFLQLLPEGGALTTTLERTQAPLFGVLGGLFVPNLFGDRRHLLALLAERIPLQDLELQQHRFELLFELDDYLPQWTVMIVGVDLPIQIFALPMSTSLRLGGVHRFGAGTRLTSIPSSNIANCVASSSTSIASSAILGKRNRPRSSRL